ncbi:peptidoglycan-binding domain-containing protein [Sedimentitalea todarodis]|uniref:Peptidoglycan-binding domain-containing protein n=1 Tax=Sedimentitalea todarodis TaxID=1631240 RepID=A0ABU3VB16_9RHOB|nr:peptidoglycan-binding domain-containing protein [Sedimentitalea todarodis]MDU9003375.1 peptidoglycan-binding domain-containing protein [Sedimentitalea todarodis]
MFTKRLFTSLVAASLIAVPAQRAVAGDAAALLGGALLGGIIVNEVHKNKQRQRTTTRRTTRTYSSGISSAQRAENRQVQTALNYFGYHVGSVDGSLGRKSRSGISRYQADMGFQPDGYMDTYEKDFLLGSYQRSLASSSVPPYNQIVATQGYGGLLRTYRNEQLGIQTPNPNIQSAAVQAPAPVPVAPAPVPVAAPAPTPAPAPVPTQPEPVTARADTGALPDFTFGQVPKSVNEYCNEINVLTAANGGITTAGRVTDAEFALNEQFCLARTHAMAESTSIVSTIPNMTDAQIAQQCEGLSQAIAPHMVALETARPDKVIGDTAGFLQGSGRPMDQLVSGGKVCLGVGYRTDNASMALASAVLLASSGQLGYGEMVSHHMREGFGTAKASPQQSGAWMNLAMDSLAGGGTTVLGQSSDRVAVLKEAMQGGSSAANSAAALPVFAAPSNN